MGNPTVKDVARHAGVSPMTVSRVINQGSAVSADTRARVQKAIDALGYAPDLAARSLRSTHPFAIALAYDGNPNANYIISMQNGVLSACRERGYELLIHPYDSAAPDLLDELERLARNSRLAGLVLTPPMSEDAELIARLRRAKRPFARIIAARAAPSDGAACVCVDDHGAAHAITRHLIELGHRRIAFLWGDPQYRSSVERYQGYVDALREHDIPLRKSLVLPGTYVYEDGVRRTDKLLATRQPPSAIFASNDEIAAGALAAARAAGYEVPRDLSIAGFEDNPFSRQARPALTTARQSTREIGRRAALLLLESLEDGATRRNERFVPELVVRDSTGPAPG